MTPYYVDAHLTVHQGDARAVLADLPAESVHCVVTSPPYWGLRDYGVPGQLGLEATPEAYVAALVDVFREVRRVLRADGTVWLNLGDSYAAARGGTTMPAETLAGGENGWMPDGSRVNRDRHDGYSPSRNASAIGLKHKDLVGIPWRVAFALQADGWYFRSDIIWSKPNPMPESVTDRPTKSHEYLFLLSKSARYYFDADAVREAAMLTGGGERATPDKAARDGQTNNGTGLTTLRSKDLPAGRNIRTVWTIATQPYPGAHFATFPEKLVEPCVKAGTSERGVCPECGAPWVRVVERTPNPSKGTNTGIDMSGGAAKTSNPQTSNGMHRNGTNVAAPAPTTTGWRPTCAHYTPDGEADFPVEWQAKTRTWRTEKRPTFSGAYATVLAVVLDPFAGTGTVGLVAQYLGRRAVLIDLSADYLVQCLERNRQVPLGLGA